MSGARKRTDREDAVDELGSSELMAHQDANHLGSFQTKSSQASQLHQATLDLDGSRKARQVNIGQARSMLLIVIELTAAHVTVQIAHHGVSHSWLWF